MGKHTPVFDYRTKRNPPERKGPTDEAMKEGTASQVDSYNPIRIITPTKKKRRM